MKFRNEWLDEGTFSDMFYTKEETIDSVKSNFDIRRYYSAEGYSVVVDGVIEQVIIQDHSNPIHQSDVDKKIIVSMVTDIHTGSYVDYKNQTWLINSNVNIVDDAYKECQMQLCNYTLKFQSNDGTILSYPCVADNRVQGTGDTNTKVMTLPAGRKVILLPHDEHTVLLRNDRRLFIDIHPTNPVPYEIDFVDSTKFKYGDKGLLEVYVSESQLQSDDRVDLGVCNYFEPSGEIEPPVKGYSYAIITCSNPNNEIKLDSSIYRTLTPTFYTSDDEVSSENITAIWNWDLPIGYESYFDIVYDGNRAKIKVKRDPKYNLLGMIFKCNVMGSNGGYGGSIKLMITV